MKACMKQFLKRETLHAKDKLEFSAGWRAALEWARSQECLDEYAIEKELEEE